MKLHYIDESEMNFCTCSLLLVGFVANANMSFIFNFHLGVGIFRKLDRSVQVFYSIGFILLSYAISDFPFAIIDLLW